jgi:hypothetical protein
VRALPLILVAFLLVACHTVWAQSEPLLGYLLNESGSDSIPGGNLGRISPGEMIYPEEGAGSGLQRAALGGTYADYYRAAGLEGLGATFGRSVLGNATVGGLNFVPWVIKVDAEQRLRRADFATGLSQQNFSARTARGAGAVDAGIRWRMVDFSAGLRVSPDSRPEPFGGVRARYRQIVEVEVGWQREYLDADANLFWKDQAAAFRFPILEDGLSGWLAVHPTRFLRAKFRWRQHQWLRQSGPTLDNTLQPWGDDREYHGFLAADRGSWTMLAGARGLQMNLMAYGMKGDNSWAKITRADLTLDAVFASVERRYSAHDAHLLAEIEHTNLSGTIRGHVEFWPFTSGLVDLLGLRRYFLGNANAEMWRVHVAGRRELTRHWSGGLGFNLAEARMDATLDLWQPEFLGLGKTDEPVNRLGLYRFVAGVASFSVNYRVGPWSLAYGFDQIVPIKSWTRRDQTEPSAESGAPARASVKYGGATHRLSVVFSS